MSWLDDAIEEGIREPVKLLRENGFNTVSSCHHDMHIDMVLRADGEAKRLHDVLYNAGHRDYLITITMRVMGGHLYEHARVDFQKTAST